MTTFTGLPVRATALPAVNVVGNPVRVVSPKVYLLQRRGDVLVPLQLQIRVGDALVPLSPAIT